MKFDDAVMLAISTIQNSNETQENVEHIKMSQIKIDKKDISVDYSNNSLTIKSKKDDSKSNDVVHRGISQRAFTRTFALADDVVVNGAKFENGLLSIELEKIVPEEKRPKEIKIK